MNLERFREKVRYYRPLTERTQEDLAKALGLSPYVLSHKLHGTRNARLTHREVQAVVNTLHSHPGRIWAVVFSPDGRMVLSASEDRPMLCWNVGTGECVNRVRHRLYEGMNITGSTGLTDAQKAALRALGAVEGSVATMRMFC